MPSSVEIIEPSELKLSERYLSHIIYDLQAKLHKLDLSIKQTKNENMSLQKNMSLLLRNTVSIIARKQGRTLSEISKLSGLPEESMKIFLENLVKQNIFEKDYMLPLVLVIDSSHGRRICTYPGEAI